MCIIQEFFNESKLYHMQKERSILRRLADNPLRTLATLGSMYALLLVLTTDYTVSAQSADTNNPLSPIATVTSATETPTPEDVKAGAVNTKNVACIPNPNIDPGTGVHCYLINPVTLFRSFTIPPTPSPTPDLGQNTFWEDGDEALNCTNTSCAAILFSGITEDNCPPPRLLHQNHSSLELNVPFQGRMTFEEYNAYYDNQVAEAIYVQDTGTILVLSQEVAGAYRIHWIGAGDFQVVLSCNIDENGTVQAGENTSVRQITKQQLKDEYGIDADSLNAVTVSGAEPD
jgi:hypothetical protein